MLRIVKICSLSSALSFALINAATAASSLSGEPVLVGVLANLTGPETSSSVDMVRGVEFAIDELNSSGGISGRPLKQITEDAEYQPQKGIDAAHKLIDLNKVPVILNIGGSGIMLPVSQYAATQNVVLINTGASSPKLRTVKTLCSVVPLDDIVGKVLGKWAFDAGFHTAATVVPSNPYGVGVQDNAKLGFEAAGGKIVGQVAYTEGQADYRPEVQQIAAMKPDVILSATYGDDANLFLKQTHEAGLNAPWYVTYPTILTVQDPSTANGRLFGLEVGWDLLEAQHFMKDVYAVKYGKVPATPWASYAYDGTMLVGLAMRQCGPTADCVLSKIRDVASTYKGVTGTIEFDKDCQRPNASLLKMGYVDGKLTPLK